LRETILSERARILIVRLSAIGDTIQTLPLAAALKRAHPDCLIGWVVEKPSSPLIVGNPAVDWHYTLPRGWLKSLSAVSGLRRALGAQRFTVALDPQGLTKSAVVALLSGAGLRIGFRRGEAREIAPLLDNRLVAPRGRHVVDMTLSLLNGLGLEPPGRPEFVFPPCPPEEKRSIDAHMEAAGCLNGYVLFGPWAMNASKCWPISRYAELAERLRGKTGYSALALGHGGKERTAVAEAAAKSNGALSLAPEVSLLGVIELERRAKLFVGGDSFPLHTAYGAGCPAVGLFAVSDPERVGPLGDRALVVYEKLTLTSSSRERQRLDQTNMLALGVDTVEQACLNLLEASRPS
jgi:ADP-heptose:LPS heptosyltransferase